MFPELVSLGGLDLGPEMAGATVSFDGPIQKTVEVAANETYKDEVPVGNYNITITSLNGNATLTLHDVNITQDLTNLASFDLISTNSTTLPESKRNEYLGGYVVGSGVDFSKADLTLKYADPALSNDPSKLEFLKCHTKYYNPIGNTCADPNGTVNGWVSLNDFENGNDTVKATMNSLSAFLIRLPISNRPPVISNVPGSIEVNETDLVVLTPVVTDLDGDDVSVAIDSPLANGPWQTNYNSAGVYNITITAKDLPPFGNHIVTKSVKVVLKNVNRMPVMNDTSDQKWHNLDIAVTLSVSDPDKEDTIAEIHYIVNNGQEVVVKNVDTTKVSVTTESDNNMVEYWAVDSEGGVGERKITDGIKLDKTAPNTDDNAPAVWQNSDVLITLTAQDTLSGAVGTHYAIYKDGVASVEKSISNEGPPVINYEDDNNWIEYWSIDVAGNSEKHTIKKAIKLDKTKPVITINVPANGSMVYDTEVKVDFDVSDPKVQGTPSGVNKVNALFDKVAVISGQVIDLTQYAGGSYSVSIGTDDKAGNAAHVVSKFDIATPRAINVKVMNTLAPYKDNKKINDAIGKIQNVLSNKWKDEWRLSGGETKKEFDDARDATRRLMDASKEKKVSKVVKNVADDAARKITKAEWLLAIVAIKDAEKVVKNKKLDKAKDELNKGFEKEQKGEYDKAIDNYKSAWDEAQKAIRK